MSKKSLLAVLAILCGLSLMLSLSAPAYGQAKAKDTIILKGAPMGGVKFEHKLHTERAENKCEVCHHASKPEKALDQLGTVRIEIPAQRFQEKIVDISKPSCLHQRFHLQ